MLAEDPYDRTTRARSDELERGRRRSDSRDDVWVLEDILESTKSRGRAPKSGARPNARGGSRPGERPVDTTMQRRGRRAERPPSLEIVEEFTIAVGRGGAPRLVERLAAATRMYERDRYFDAMRITASLVEKAPTSAAARELHGLVCYRLGRFGEAIRNLEAARSLLGDDPDQLPVIMDCHRALGHHRRVENLYKQLRAASPDADVLVEGRLIVAADMADRGLLPEAVEMLATSGAARNLRHPGERHIRQWYVLADLYERAGELPRARELFARVVGADPELADAQERLAALGSPGRKRPSPPQSRSRRPAKTTGSTTPASKEAASGRAPAAGRAKATASVRTPGQEARAARR